MAKKAALGFAFALTGCVIIIPSMGTSTKAYAGCGGYTSKSAKAAKVNAKGLDDTQRLRAGEIISVGREMKLPEHALLVALTVGLAESGLYHYANDGTSKKLNKQQRAARIERSQQFPHDKVGRDHGSVNVFQQQVAIWGTVEELMDPQNAARLFFKALVSKKNWDTRPVHEVAQEVQGSAVSDGSNYEEQVDRAQRILKGTEPGVGNDIQVSMAKGAYDGCVSPPITDERIKKVLDWANSRKGRLYRLGANGDDAYDCSGFVQTAFKQIGIGLPRTAEEQRKWLGQGHATRIQWGQERPGDIILYNTYLGPSEAGHVIIVNDPAKKESIEANSPEVGNRNYSHVEKKELLEIWRLGDPTVQAGGNTQGWAAPLKPGYTLTSRFGPRSQPGPGASKFHKGLDLAQPVGTPIYAASAGTIGISGPADDYGNLIRIEHGNGIATQYGHMSKLHVKVGDKVNAGQLIADVGNEGVSFGAHLHFEVWQGAERIDPLPFMHQRGIKLD